MSDKEPPDGLTPATPEPATDRDLEELRRAIFAAERHAVACVSALAGVDVERFAARLAELRAEAGKPCSCDESDDSLCPACEAVGWLDYLGLEAQP